MPFILHLTLHSIWPMETYLLQELVSVAWPLFPHMQPSVAWAADPDALQLHLLLALHQGGGRVRGAGGDAAVPTTLHSLRSYIPLLPAPSVQPLTNEGFFFLRRAAAPPGSHWLFHTSHPPLGPYFLRSGGIREPRTKGLIRSFCRLRSRSWGGDLC